MGLAWWMGFGRWIIRISAMGPGLVCAGAQRLEGKERQLVGQERRLGFLFGEDEIDDHKESGDSARAAVSDLQRSLEIPIEAIGSGPFVGGAHLYAPKANKQGSSERQN